MKITYRHRQWPGRVQEKKTFQQIIEKGIEGNEPGELEGATALARASIRFTEAVIDVLWKKGVLSDANVIEILKSVDSPHPNHEIKIER